MLIKVDKRTWIEVPNDATEEFKKAKIEKYNSEQQKKLDSLKSNKYIGDKSYKHHTVGVLYDKRISLTTILKNL